MTGEDEKKIKNKSLVIRQNDDCIIFKFDGEEKRLIIGTVFSVSERSPFWKNNIFNK